MTRRIHKDDLRLDVDPAPLLDPARSVDAAFRGQQRAAAAVKLRVQAIFYTAAAKAAEARGAPFRAVYFCKEATKNLDAARALEVRR